MTVLRHEKTCQGVEKEEEQQTGGIIEPVPQLDMDVGGDEMDNEEVPANEEKGSDEDASTEDHAGSSSIMGRSSFLPRCDQTGIAREVASSEGMDPADSKQSASPSKEEYAYHDATTAGMVLKEYAYHDQPRPVRARGHLYAADLQSCGNIAVEGYMHSTKGAVPFTVFYPTFIFFDHKSGHVYGYDGLMEDCKWAGCWIQFKDAASVSLFCEGPRARAAYNQALKNPQKKITIKNGGVSTRRAFESQQNERALLQFDIPPALHHEQGCSGNTIHALQVRSKSLNSDSQSELEAARIALFQQIMEQNDGEYNHPTLVTFMDWAQRNAHTLGLTVQPLPKKLKERTVDNLQQEATKTSSPYAMVVDGKHVLGIDFTMEQIFDPAKGWRVIMAGDTAKKFAYAFLLRRRSHHQQAPSGGIMA